MVEPNCKDREDVGEIALLQSKDFLYETVHP